MLIPIIASIIEINPIKEIFSLRKKYQNIARNIVCVLIIKTTLATVVFVIATTNAIKLSDITNPPNTAGKPASFKIFIVFFLYVIAKKPINAIIKKNDLNNNICQTLASSKDLITNPPQLKQNPPNKRSIYPGIL